MNRIFIACILLCISMYAIAQPKISGTIRDARTKAVLQGASVQLNGKPVAISDKEGHFSLVCKTDALLQVSFVGYETIQQKLMDCSTPLNLYLLPVKKHLADVAISASAQSRKADVSQPFSIAKLSSTELRRNEGLYLDDAINANVPGVSMQRRAISSGQQFNIRGYGNGVRGTNGISSNFDGQGSKVYLNGIPVTDAEGITVMDDIDFNAIGNVEITKGPSGTLYGLAIAGAVNLYSAKPEKNKTTIGQDLMAGSDGLRRYTTHFETATDKSSLLLSYGHQLSDGYMVHTASHKDFVNLVADFQANEKQQINAYFGYSNSYDERGGELTIAQYNNMDYSGNPEYIKRNGHSEIIGFRAGLGHQYRFNDHLSNHTTVFASGVSNNASSAAGWTDKSPINIGLRSTLDLKWIWEGGYILHGSVGIEWQQQNAQTIGYNMVANPANASAYWIIGAMKSNQSTISATSTQFATCTLNMPKDYSITSGLGISSMHIELNDKFYVSTNANPTKFATNYTGMLSPQIAVNKKILKNMALYASYSVGYKAPVSSYFFIPATGQLNTGLKPERGNQFEIGSKGNVFADKLNYELALFDARFNDKMTAIAVPLNGSVNTTAYSYIANSGSQVDQGIELSLKYNAFESATSIFNSIKPFANFAYSDFKYKGYSFQTLSADRLSAVIADYDGKAVAGVAPWTGNMGVDLNLNMGLYASITWSYKDAMPISSDGLNKTVSYQLLNSKLGYRNKLSEKWSLDAYAGALNMTGTQYALMVFANQLPDAYLPAPNHINYFGGLHLKYSF